MDNLEVLETTDINVLEDYAIAGVGMVRSGATIIGMALNEIFSKKLWEDVLDEKGLPVYANQKEYEEYLVEKLNISRATIYNYLMPARIAFGPTMHLAPAEYIETGGYKVWSKLRKYLEYNSKTGEITSIDVDTVENIRNFVLENIEDFKDAEVDLSPGDLQKEIKERFSPNGDVLYFEGLWDSAGFRLGWVYNNDKGIVGENRPPQPVIEALYQKLKITTTKDVRTETKPNTYFFTMQKALHK